MQTAILFAIWINQTCSIGYDHYIYEGKIYWLDTHIEDLYKKFEQSQYYRESLIENES